MYEQLKKENKIVLHRMLILNRLWLKAKTDDERDVIEKSFKDLRAINDKHLYYLGEYVPERYLI